MSASDRRSGAGGQAHRVPGASSRVVRVWRGLPPERRLAAAGSPAPFLNLLFIRAEGGAFHVPGGDGGVITAAGLWTCVLIIWRIFDKEGTTGHGQYATTSGIEWGGFIGLAVAGGLTYAGSPIPHAHGAEPPLPG